MFDWIGENAGTIAVCLVLAGIVALAVRSVIRDRKKGGSCGCGCAACAMRESCHGKGQDA